jgi:hypothetical protein
VFQEWTIDVDLLSGSGSGECISGCLMSAEKKEKDKGECKSEDKGECESGSKGIDKGEDKKDKDEGKKKKKKKDQEVMLVGLVQWFHDISDLREDYS